MESCTSENVVLWLNKNNNYLLWLLNSFMSTEQKTNSKLFEEYFDQIFVVFSFNQLFWEEYRNW